jgi:hypothetical protein
MRTWVNTQHDNTEGNECVCPRCRFKRELIEDRHLTPAIMRERTKIIQDWDNRMDGLKAHMAKRFSDE